jgi:integrase
MANRYGDWLGWLKRNGLFDPGADLAAQVTSELVKRYVADLETTYSSMSIADSLQKLKLVARILNPSRDWAWLHKIWKHYQRKVKPAREKRSRMVDAKNLFALGIELMDRAEASSHESLLSRALLYRDGLMIALLAACSMRLKNLTSIEIGKQITKVGPNWQLDFDASEMKGRRPYRPQLPSELSVRIDHYLAHHRPVLFPLNRGCDRPAMHDPAACRALWVSERGRAASAQTIYRRITARTRTKFGRSVNPHLFRDCVATTVAVRDPERVRTTMSLLGHGKYATTERHYIRARSVEACQRLHDTIRNLRGLNENGRDEKNREGPDTRKGRMLYRQ